MRDFYIASALVRGAYRTAAGALGLLGLKTAVRSYVLPRLLEAALDDGSSIAHAHKISRQWVDDEIRAALEKPGRIVVGPWTSEVGFELLYWIPFLTDLCQRFDVPKDRLVVLSRGGAGSWYRHIADETLDIFDWVEPDTFRQRTQERWQALGGQKQIMIDRWERELLEETARRSSGIGRGVLHPSLMYTLFRGVWRQAVANRHLFDRMKFLGLPAPDPTPIANLPEDYVAIRFYFRPSFPDTPANRRLIASLIERLADRHPVVLLNPRLEIDDHSDWLPSGGKGLIDIADAMTPATNLAVQSAAIAGARAFVGTYGGLSYLAPLFGKPSVALVSDADHIMPIHGEVADRAADAAGGRLMILKTSDLALLDLLLGIDIDAAAAPVAQAPAAAGGM